jgi:hypothetical protein
MNQGLEKVVKKSLILSNYNSFISPMYVHAYNMYVCMFVQYACKVKKLLINFRIEVRIVLENNRASLAGDVTAVKILTCAFEMLL